MAQLSDDCFAFGGPMMSVDEAVAIIAARVTAVQDVETVDLRHADGRVLAAGISAPLPLPPFTNSAVDGYAVRSGDLSGDAEQTFPVAGRIQAGASAQEPVKPGHAVRIFTGAPMPEGADTVFMQEDVRLDEAGRVVLPDGAESRRQCPPGRRRHWCWHAGFTGGPAPAAAGCRARRRIRPDADRGAQAHPCRGVFDRQRTCIAGRAARGRATLRLQSLHADGDAGAARLRGQRSRHPARRSRLARERLEEGGRCARSDPDHRRGFDRRRGSRQGQRRKCRHAGALAHGDQAGTSGRDGDHRRHAVYRPARKPGGEFCHVCPRRASDGAGAGGRPAAEI